MTAHARPWPWARTTSRRRCWRARGEPGVVAKVHMRSPAGERTKPEPPKQSGLAGGIKDGSTADKRMPRGDQPRGPAMHERRVTRLTGLGSRCRWPRARRQVDWLQVAKAVAQGCPPRLALQIIS